MALNNIIADIINSQITLFFEKMNEKYSIEIPEMKEMWENLEVAPTPTKNEKAEKPKKTKDPNVPKKPRSAYILFSSEKRPIVKKASPELSFGNLNKMLGEMWQTEKSKNSTEYQKFMKMSEDEKKNGRPVEPEQYKKSSEDSDEGKKSKKEKCGKILQTGKNKGCECGAPVKEKGLCARHLEQSEKSSEDSDDSVKGKSKKGSSGEETTVEKCGRVLQSGKNKGCECGAPVKEKGLCARHLTADKKASVKKETPDNSEASDNSEDEKSKKSSAKKETLPKGMVKNDIKFLNDKLIELDEKKIEAIFIQNFDAKDEFYYYTITSLGEELFMIQKDFDEEIELDKGCDNSREQVVETLTNVDYFYVINKGHDRKKLLKSMISK